MLKFLLLSCISFALYANADTEIPSLRISRGSDADIKDFPYQVSIRDTRFKYPHICGGFIYQLNVIITAANCIAKRPPPNLQVYYGSDKIDNDGKIANISGIIIHPDYDEQMRFNDIAVLFLKTPIPEGPTSKPIEIAQLEEIENKLAIVTGWGCNGNNICFSGRLQSLNVSITPDLTCQNELGPLKDMICAVSPQGSLGTCYGDNGNPLTTDVKGSRKLIGVVSFIGTESSLCAGDKPTVYTLVPAFLDWIKTFTQ